MSSVTQHYFGSGVADWDIDETASLEGCRLLPVKAR
jgi:hypothetical protein